MTLTQIWSASNDELARLIANGHAINPNDLVDGDYRGVALGMPPWIERMSWKVFRKVFRRDANGDVIGHNVRMEQTQALAPLQDGGERTKPLLKNGAPFTFGPYLVRALPADGTPFGCNAGLLLDYGARHPAWSPLSLVRDPIVALERGNARVLLGATYLSGPVSVRTPSFFTLERE